MRDAGRAICTAGVLAAVVLAVAVAPARANVRSQALYARGLIPFNGGKWDDAYRLFDRAVQADRADAVALYYRGLAQARRGLSAAAIQDMSQALQLNPTLPHAALDLGVAYFDAGQYPEAKTWLERAHAQGGDRPTAAFFLGLTALRLGDNAAALTYFDEAKAAPELKPVADYYSGLALARQGQTDAARSALEQTARDLPQSEIGQVAQRYTTTELRRPSMPLAGPLAKPWSLYGSLGFAYDSNVVAGPSESDVSGRPGISGKDDGSTEIGFGGGYTLLDSDLGSVRASYDFYQSVHFSLTEFDLQGHRVQLLAASAPTGMVRYGIAGTYDFYALDYQSFYQEGLGTPWVSIAEGSDAATQAYYTLRGRDFFRAPFNPGRDSINNAAGLRQFVALGDPRWALGIGYQFDAEDTVSNGPMGNDFQYKGNQFDVDVAIPVLAETRIEVGYLLRFEDYQFVNSRPNRDGSFVRRHDVGNRVAAAAVHDLTEHLALTFDFIGIINNSNIPNFEYDRNIVSAGVRVVF